MIIEIVETDGVKYLKPLGDWPPAYELLEMLIATFGLYDSKGNRNYCLVNHDGYETAVELRN